MIAAAMDAPASPGKAMTWIPMPTTSRRRPTKGMEPSQSAVLASRENGDYQRTTGTIHRESLNTGRPRSLTPRFFPVSLNRGLPADFGVTCENAYRDLGDSHPRSGRDDWAPGFGERNAAKDVFSRKMANRIARTGGDAPQGEFFP